MELMALRKDRQEWKNLTQFKHLGRNRYSEKNNMILGFNRTRKMVGLDEICYTII